MRFWVYHKTAQQWFGPFDEKSIVDFCTGNKDSIKQYYFSAQGKSEKIEWESFALKYASLFSKKATEREEQEEIEIEINSHNAHASKKPLLFVLVLLLAAGAAYVYLNPGIIQSALSDKKEIKSGIVTESNTPQKKKPETESRFPMKRPAHKNDTALSHVKVSRKELQKAWKGKKNLPKSLSPEAIKQHMDSMLDSLATCHSERIKAGDRNLKGEIRMKVLVAGSGRVLDVLFTASKYQSSLFGDCIEQKIREKDFPPFKSKKQTFSYYFSL